ncbi:LysR family transcriptional regulator [Photobacterium phosphoreum]|uniref:LysR substrate-binding domain-containing protein n=1 Tax=Photobacterium phosphoreum TaxID=659 RepID=UPI001E4AF4A6|nr:LysR substrate-binding domain-containing protein [Photobacterium phosphoreum]MCD9501757.1 LysR family transcriptional regulator [Photobacterium phosphoreum]
MLPLPCSSAIHTLVSTGLSADGAIGLSAATVTARLQALEERYGVKLLNRSTRHLSLTESGAMYHQASLGIIDSVKETENLLQTGSQEVRGTIKIAAPQYLANKGTPITPQDLADHHCLAMIRSNEELKTWHFSDDTQHNVITVLPKRFSDDGEVIRQWALDSAGIALKSILDIEQDIKQQRLVTVLDRYMKNFNASTSSASADLNVIYQSRQYQPKWLRLFIDFLIARFADRLG